MTKYLFFSTSKQNHSEITEWLNNITKTHEEYDIDEVVHLAPQYTYFKDGPEDRRDLVHTTYTHCVYVRMKKVS